MNPIKTDSTNLILKAPAGMENCIDLPATRIVYGDGLTGIESCWTLSPEELEEVKRTGCVYLVVVGRTQPPVSLSPYSSLTGQAEGQYDTGVNPLEGGAK